MGEGRQRYRVDSASRFACLQGLCLEWVGEVTAVCQILDREMQRPDPPSRKDLLPQRLGVLSGLLGWLQLPRAASLRLQPFPGGPRRLTH